MRGANVRVRVDGQTLAENGDPYVFQRDAPPPEFDGRYPIVGSWMVNGYACGVGIREG